jgi:hypothetical protein
MSCLHYRFYETNGMDETMSRELRRQIAYGAALVVFIGAAGVTRELATWAGAVSALCAGATLDVYVLRSDEVERGLAVNAAAAAFALLLAAAIALQAVGRADLITAIARELWAAMFATYLVCWIALRIRLG